MKERPLLMCGKMVRATLRDVDPKTQTRRAMKPQPSEYFSPSAVEVYSPAVADKDGFEDAGPEIFGCYDRNGEDEGYKCPYGQPGDRLWVRETFRRQRDCPTMYRATTPMEDSAWKWTPSIFMPRKLSRITLEIENVRVERLKSICHNDCLAEGLPDGNHLQRAYWDLWDSINGKGASDANPWVWAITFRRLA